MLLGRMFWTDKGPKYLVMLIILSLVIYMFATLLGSTNIAEDIGTSSKVHIIKLSIQRQSGSTKGHLISKANCQDVNSSKNEGMNLFYYYGTCFCLFFWKKLMTPKRHFDIN